MVGFSVYYNTSSHKSSLATDGDAFLRSSLVVYKHECVVHNDKYFLAFILPKSRQGRVPHHGHTRRAAE